MTNFHRPVFSRFIRCAALVAVALTASTAMAQDATPDAGCVPRLTALQQRIYDKAGQGPSALRDFMFARRAILQLDIYDTASWVAAVDEARAVCAKNAARAQASPSLASIGVKN